ncbi:MAG: heavy-metal-associated domain-containing protein [Bacteroidales bacterium]|nr:heavy-metal-associated domain-containing protein [Bacteroidales bacterium]
MKRTFRLITAAAFVFAAMSFTSADAKDAKIKVNGVCGMCKTKIEKTAKSVKGVKAASWDAQTKELTLDYNEKLTDVKTISQAIAKVGYDAGDVKADKDARAKLPACCKAPSGNSSSVHSGCSK